MIKINKNKHKMYIVNKLTKGEISATTMTNRLQEIESEEGFASIKERIVSVVIDATKYIEQGIPILWGGQEIQNKRELWKELNEMGVYYTVPFWKLDKTIKDIIQIREAQQALMDKEQQLIIRQLLKN